MIPLSSLTYIFLICWVYADYILQVIKDILSRFEISSIEKPFQKIRGQNYDGARSLSGVKNGVNAQILRQEKRALGVHYYAHSTN